MAFGTFMIPDTSGAFYQNSLLVQARGQLVLTKYTVSQRPYFVNQRDRSNTEEEVYESVKRDDCYVKWEELNDNELAEWIKRLDSIDMGISFICE